MFQMLDTFAEFERALIQERLRVGWRGRRPRAPRAASRSVGRQSIPRGVRPSALPGGLRISGVAIGAGAGGEWGRECSSIN
jgi:hypothetical protein